MVQRLANASRDANEFIVDWNAHAAHVQNAFQIPFEISSWH